MGTRLDNFKSEVKDLIEYLFSRKGASKFPDKIDHDMVFKNHAVLMEAYGTVLKKDSKIFDMFFRSLFVESHICKKLRSLRKIYLVEIATLYDKDNNNIRLTLNSLVEDIDKFSGCLFYFPTITIKTIISVIPIIAAAIAVVSHIPGFFPGSWSYGVNSGSYIMLLSALGLTVLVYLGFAALSFIDKRLLFIFLEDKPQKYFGKWKKRWKAFFGKNIEGTIYEKENKLFTSLRMRKELESPVDIYLFVAIILVLVTILVTLSILTPNQFAYSFWLLIMPITFFFVARRKAS